LGFPKGIFLFFLLRKLNKKKRFILNNNLWAPNNVFYHSNFIFISLFALAFFSNYGMEMIGTRGGQKTGERKIMETGRGIEKGFGGEK